jgi:hypothetical protein
LWDLTVYQLAQFWFEVEIPLVGIAVAVAGAVVVADVVAGLQSEVGLDPFSN